MRKNDLKKLTLEEKISLLTGVGNWKTADANGKLKQMWLSDGPSGLRMHDEHNRFETIRATALPTCHVLSNTWDLALCAEYAATIADEAILHGADVVLGPAVNVKRSPLYGRNFEYFSEDPFLAGTMGRAYVESMQSKGIGTSVKHYCVNNREFDRCHQSSEVDERALHEIYLKPFEMTLAAKPWTVMCSYNPVNGVYASENKKLLDDVLRGQLGFDGLIMSDWGAVHDPVRAVEATLDLCMPQSNDYPTAIAAALNEGRLTESRINERAQKVLDLLDKCAETQSLRNVTGSKESRHETAVKIAREGIVLLKNEGVLPLSGTQKVFLYGT
ncbi:MAG: glycoside hydrolase family 3 protein, partial [Candidatus Gallimonas sp.]